MTEPASPTVHRKTLHRYENPGQARFLTFSCQHRLALLGTARLRDHFAKHIERQRSVLGFTVMAWVIMPEHAHLLIVLPEDCTMSRVLGEIKRPFAIEVLARWRELKAPVLPRLVDPTGKTRFWQPGAGFDRNVFGRNIGAKIAYIHNNPVTRGLVARPNDWAWSSSRAYSRLEDGPIKVQRMG